MEQGVLLPRKQVPDGIKVGDELEVFLYKDSEDRLIATVREPLLTIGELGLLTVVQAGSIGAFLDWGLERDLFLPFKEQKWKVRKGEKVLVSLYTDKSRRLCATMKIDKYLSCLLYTSGSNLEVASVKKGQWSRAAYFLLFKRYSCIRGDK